MSASFNAPLDIDARRLAMAVQKSRNVVIVTDRNDAIVLVNEGFTRVTGYTSDEVKGRRPADFLPGPATDRGIVRRIAFVDERLADQLRDFLDAYRLDELLERIGPQ